MARQIFSGGFVTFVFLLIIALLVRITTGNSLALEKLVPSCVICIAFMVAGIGMEVFKE